MVLLNQHYIKKWLFALMAIILLSFQPFNGFSQEKQQIWFKKPDYKGVERRDAVGFSINQKGYIGTGTPGSDISSGYRKDFWKFNPVIDSWTQIPDLKDEGRHAAVSFVIKGQAYVGLGRGNNLNRLKDFWKYNPDSLKWIQIKGFTGRARTGAVAFAINEKGYVGLGYADSALKDFWQYDPSTGQWKRIADFPGDGRYGAVTFSLKQKAYVGLGSNGDSLLDDFWQYDPSTGQWKRIADFGGSPRINSVGFTANGKGFVGTGDGKNKGSRKDFWKYDPVSNKWNRISGFKGGERRLAVGFSIGDKGYIGTGIGPHLHNKKDFWCINPDSIKESTSIALIKIKRKRACYIFPNPIYNSNRVYLHCKPHNKIPEQISLYNMQGKKATFTGIQQSKFKNPSNEMKLTIDIPASFSPGVYFVEIKFDSSIEYHKLILE